MLFTLFVMFLFLLVLAWACTATFYAYRWATIILLLEDDLTEAVEVHERTVGVLDKILSTPLFFDSPEVRKILQEAMDDVKVCKMATQKLINTFTARSKQRYILVTPAESNKELEE